MTMPDHVHVPVPVDRPIQAVGTGSADALQRLRIDDYPQLSLLAWNRSDRTISGEDALALYEREWAWVDQHALTALEWNLIHQLVARYGKGVLLV